MKKNRIIQVVAVFLAIIISGCAVYFREQKILKNDIKLGEKYFLDGEYNKSISQYEKVFQKDKKNPLWNAKISEVYSVKGDINKSKEYISKVKKMNYKENENVINYIVFTEFMNKDYEKALKDGEDGLKLYPKNKDLIKNMFSVYMANNKLDEAKNIIKTYKVDKDSAYDIAQYANMLIISGNKKVGFEKLKDAYKIDKDEIKIYDIISEMSVYDFDETLQNITYLSQKNPKDIIYKTWLAKVYSLTKETSESALKILDDKSMDKESIEVQILKAISYENIGESNKSNKIMMQLLDKYPNDYRVLHILGWYFLKKGDTGKAKMYCEKSIDKNDKYSDNYGYLMPEILKKDKDKKNQKSYFRKALFLEPYNYHLMLNAADFYWQVENDTKKAIQYYDFAQIIRPNEAEIKYNMALINLSQNKNKEAIKILKECIKIDETVPKYSRTLGTIYMIQANYKEAIKAIKDAYDADENDILTLNNAGAYYIIGEGDIEKGYYNLLKAYEGLKLSDKYDEYTRKSITENYKKSKDVLTKYHNAEAATIKVPDFVLFY
ncbi:tetratricopeptide repeat protein [Haloimpatiens sp. FM7330]|uniref:tetratricopeptide repeat protein n=1 Tax=Haloimpatiens sp. FM7330 TaxID=3298610 RepID=UPI0036299EF7